ncbi:hypothetical protein BGZ50_003718 [Haplosporangium sp. Z 11]|nr:hypothetical protein BGZ50_003718 [Haplosporangium sp. Z 11]
MSARLGSTAPSPSIANLASKVINRLANNSINNININNNNSNSNYTGIDEDEDSGENEEYDDDAGIIRCICNFTDDDGFTIQCERCLVWQHAVCVGIVQSNVPDKYLCELCSPRPVDRKRANEIQRRRNGAGERKREKSPSSRRKPSVGRPRKQFGSASGGFSEQGVLISKENGTHHSPGPSSSNGHQSKNVSGQTDPNGKRIRGSNTAGSSTSSSSHQNYSTKHKSAGQTGGSRISSATNEDDDLDMESDSQDDVSDAYQFEFSSVEMNIVTSKAVQDLFRQVIAQFRQAQSRKRSLSLTSGVKLQELVASNSASSNNGVTSVHESSDSSTVLGTLPPPSTPYTDASSVVSMERESLARPLMKTTVKHILPSSKSPHSPASQYGLFAESNIGAGRFMMEFKGEVSLKSTYRSDPINQYSILATPKPFVLFHPQLDLVVDARRSGNDARFVRRSCVPNTEVKSIVVPGVQDQTVHLGLFAKVPIGKGQEITLDWDWNKDHLALQSIKATPEKSKDGSARKSLKEIRKAKHLVASTLLAQTDCACENKDSCVLHQMLKDGLSEAGARDQESSTAVKGSRPKKATSESLRQRYGGHRDRSGPGQDEKRAVDQDTSEEDLSMAESSPRRKSPKAAKLEGPSKKARHESHTHHKTIRADQDAGSESDSDDHRRRKQNILDRQGSPFKRTSNVNQELSAREMKQALMLIKKMEDKDASQTGQIKQKSQEPGSKESRRSGITSPKPSKDKTKPQDTDQRLASPNKATVALEDDNISIGDSGIDSDSNSGLLRRDPFALDRTVPFTNKRPQATHSHGKRDRGQMEQNTSSQSPASSDSERKDSNSRSAKRTTHPQPGKKQPYSTASRGKRMAEHAHQKLRSKDRVIRHGVEMMDDIQNLSGASSVEGSFVSIVGNTSDEEEEMSHRAGRRPLRDKNLPKETLPVASLKPSVLPCKKVWKMIYLKQRALAEEEAREKAEEMKKKAEEVFDLEMGEDETSNSVTGTSTTSTETAVPPSKVAIVEDLVKPAATPEPPKDISHQSSIIEGDVLNLFHDTVKPETSSSTASRNRDEVLAESSTEPKPSVAPKTIQQPVVIPPSASSREPTTAAAAPKPADRPKTPQKLSLESYQARRLATNSTTQSEEIQAAPDTATSAVAGLSAPVANESMDVEMTEAAPSTAPLTSEAPASADAATSTQESLETKAEAAPSIPKVKLSLQEYQKKRQEASQRGVNPSVSDVLIEARAQSPEKSGSGESNGLDQGKAAIEASQETVNRPVDVEMTTEGSSDNSTSTGKQGQTARRDYFEVGTSLPTPLIGLSSRAQGVSSASGDYFPVQPFSPISLSAGPTPFSKLNLTSSPPPPRVSPSLGAQAQPNGTQPIHSPARSPGAQRTGLNVSPKETQGPNSELKSPGNKFGSSPPQSQRSARWRTPRGHRGPSPPAPGPAATSGSYRHGGGSSMSDHRPDARYYGAQQDRSERPPVVESLNSPTREQQHSVTSDNQPASPFETSSSGHYGYNDEQTSFKRSNHLSSPIGHAIPTGPRDYFKPDERSRHRSINSDDWGYGNMDNAAYGGYRGPRSAPPPPPRDRDRDRERDHERERERDRERRDRYDRRDYFVSGLPGGGSGGISGGNNGSGFYGSNRGPGGLGGGYGRRPSDYYDMHGRDEDYNSSNKRDGVQNTHPASSSAFATGPGGYSVDANSSTSPSNTRRI